MVESCNRMLWTQDADRQTVLERVVRHAQWLKVCDTFSTYAIGSINFKPPGRRKEVTAKTT